MVKITLYNIGEYKKKQFLYCFVSFFYACCLCIPNILKESKKDIYLGTRILMLRILPLRVLHLKRIIQQLSTIYVFPYSIYFLLIIEYDGFAV
jgi:hypothetical protein